MVTAIAKNQKVKDKTTIVDHINDLDWLTIGSYKLDTDNVTVYNVDWDDVVTKWTLWATVELPSPSAWTLQLVMMTNKEIKWKYTKWTTTVTTPDLPWKIELVKPTDSSKSSVKWLEDEKENIKTINEQLRWYLATGYVWFGTFDSDTTAKEFRDSYFSTWMLVSAKDGKYAVMVEISR